MVRVYGYSDDIVYIEGSKYKEMKSIVMIKVQKLNLMTEQLSILDMVKTIQQFGIYVLKNMDQQVTIIQFVKMKILKFTVIYLKLNPK